MNIGIDTDGVLTDLYAYNCSIGRKELKREPDNPAGYDVREMYGLSEKQEFRIGLKYFFRYCKKWPPREGAVEVIERLKAEGHQLYEITARKFVTKKSLLGRYSKYLLLKWYKRYGMRFTEIILCSEEHSPEEKLAGCIRKGVKLMIEDKPDVALHLAENGITVLLFDAKYNQSVQHKNMVRVYSWKEIAVYVQQIH